MNVLSPDRSSGLSRRNRFLESLGLGVCVVQILVIVWTYGSVWIPRIWRNRGSIALDRSQNYVLGNSGSAYMDFLQEQTGPESTIVIPPEAVQFSEQNLLQFYLMPRSIVSCGCDRTNAQDQLSQSCIRCMQSSGYFVPSIGDFPPRELMEPGKVFVPGAQPTEYFRGLYAPSESLGQVHPDPEPPDFNLINLLFIDGFIVALLFALGSIATIHLTRRLNGPEIIIFAFPLGAGVYTWTLFLASWVGLPIGMPLVMGTFAALVTVALLALRARIRTGAIKLDRPKIETNLFLKFARENAVLTLVFIFIFTLSVFISLGRAYSTFDGIANWALKGYAFAEFGTISAGEHWGGQGSAYPMNLPLLITSFRVLDGDLLPGSKVLFPLFTLSLVLGCMKALRQRGVSSQYALMGGLVFYSLPHVFLHSTIGFANLPFTLYLVLGVLWVTHGMNNSPGQSPGVAQRSLGLGVWMLAFAAWTRPEGLGFCLVLIAGLVLVHWRSSGRRRLILHRLWPILVIPGIWLIYAIGPMDRGLAGFTLRSFGEAVEGGNFSLNALGQILLFAGKQLVNIRFWGLIVPLITIIFVFKRREFQLAKNLDLVLTTLLGAAVPIGLVFVSSFRIADFPNSLTINWDRWVFPFAALATVLTFTLLREPRSPKFKNERLDDVR